MEAEKPEPIKTPFCILVDSSEQLPYTFRGLRANVDKGGGEIQVITSRVSLPTGDYSLGGHDIHGITIERKTKEDLYSSISGRRDNFIERLERMSLFDFAAVVVEADWVSLLHYPPPRTQFSPKSLARTIQAWIMRYNVHWLMVPDRAFGEAFTFRLIERFWKDQQRYGCAGFVDTLTKYDAPSLRQLDGELLSDLVESNSMP